MTPYINENWDEMQTKKDWLLVRVWRQGLVWPWEREIIQPRLERGMVVSFRYEDCFLLFSFFSFGCYFVEELEY